MDNKPLRTNRSKPANNKNRGVKNAGFIAIIVLLGLIIFAATDQPNTLQKIPLTTAVQQANAGDYSNIVVMKFKSRKKVIAKPPLSHISNLTRP
jgi:hypothetical protein